MRFNSLTPLVSTAVIISFDDSFGAFFSFTAVKTLWFSELQFASSFSVFASLGVGVSKWLLVDPRFTNASTKSAGLNSSFTTPHATRAHPPSRGQNENGLL